MAVVDIVDLVNRARSGDLDAYGRIVEATQSMAYAAAVSVLRDPALAEDATQNAYLRAFRRLQDVQDPAAFSAWLRRVVITAALNLRRSRRRMLLQLDDDLDVPVLDDAETSWTEQQRLRLAGALLTLTIDERRLCDRRYHGRWTTARLARDAGVDEAAMRKRLQRLREKLRKEIEMSEQRHVSPHEISPDFPARIVELLARPRLNDLPENPVGRVLDDFRAAFAECSEVTLPEVVDFAEARKTIGDVALYIDPGELHRVDDRRILRYDLTLPLMMTVRYDGEPLRVWAAGKAYRHGRIDAMHLEAFHQAEILWLEDRHRIDPWMVTAKVLGFIGRLLPGRAIKIVPTTYAMCSQSWELEVDDDGRWSEVLACGVFNDRIVAHLGGNPAVHTAIGVGCGLERLAMIRYGIDDIRKVESTLVA